MKKIENNFSIIAGIFLAGLFITPIMPAFSEQIQKKIGSWPGVMATVLSPLILSVLIDIILISYLVYVEKREQASQDNRTLSVLRREKPSESLKQPLLQK